MIWTVCIALALLIAARAHAQTDSTGTTPYQLEKDTSFETGCFGPCACPILLQQPVHGTFLLKHTGFDGLFDNYTVSDVIWTLPDAAASTVIQGSGQYRVGGEVAIQQQLTLDLVVGSNAPQHFDSGLVTGGSEFPRIAIDVSLHGRLACIDTVIHVDAIPDPAVTAVDEGERGLGPMQFRLAPNPFSEETALFFTLGRPGALEVMIFDAQGRLVRRLASGARVPAGTRVLRWNGTRSDGSRCPAGVYFVKARVGNRRSAGRLLRIQ